MLLAIKPGTIREAISTGYFGTMELWPEPNRLFDKRRSLSVLALVLLEKLAIPVGQAGFTGKGIRDSLAPNLYPPADLPSVLDRVYDHSRLFAVADGIDFGNPALESFEQFRIRRER